MKNKCKALKYYGLLINIDNSISEKLWDYAEQNNIVDSNDHNEYWWEMSGMLADELYNKIGCQKVFDMFDDYKSSNVFDINDFGSRLNYEEDTPKCENKKCKMWNSWRNGQCGYGDWVDQCIWDKAYNTYLAFKIGGWRAINELKNNGEITDKFYKFLKDNFDNNYVGTFEKELYCNGGYEMFLKELSDIDVTDDLSVFWIDNMVYVNDNSCHQAQTNTGLYEAYKLAVLLNATFDYDANDEEVKLFGEQLLNEVEEEGYDIDVWEYIDRISDDFEKLTGITLDIYDKRIIVSHMSTVEGNGNGNDILAMGGSATYIARRLWDYIKGRKEYNIKKSDNEIINKLADEYLQVDEYDLKKFAEELHKKANPIKTVDIDGSLWVNKCKYEYVDKIEIGEEEVNIYWNNMIIGCVLIENIDTIEEQSVKGVIREVVW